MKIEPITVFLCHSSDDKPAVRILYRRLRHDGFYPWLDEENLRPGDDWRRVITHAVRAADAVLVCLSQTAVGKTGFLQKEIAFALDRAEEQPEGRIYLIPAKLEPCFVPDRLSRWQWVDLFADNGYEKLLITLRQLRDLGAAQHRVEITSDNGTANEELDNAPPHRFENRHHAQSSSIAVLPEPMSTFCDALSNGGNGPLMVSVPSGTYLMGSAASDAMARRTEMPQHRVTIPKPFAIGRYPVTFDEFDQFCEAAGREKPPGIWGRGQRPVGKVSWEDAVAYLAWLSDQSRQLYRLPSEAEWEYACRAGTTTRWYCGDDERWLEDFAWYGRQFAGATPLRIFFPGIPFVGQKRPNAWGLHDMHGCVYEWVQDTWHKTYSNAPSDGSAWEENPDGVVFSGMERIARGGSCYSPADSCRSAFRSQQFQERSFDECGFRCVRVFGVRQDNLSNPDKESGY